MAGGAVQRGPYPTLPYPTLPSRTKRRACLPGAPFSSLFIPVRELAKENESVCRSVSVGSSVRSRDGEVSVSQPVSQFSYVFLAVYTVLLHGCLSEKGEERRGEEDSMTESMTS